MMIYFFLLGEGLGITIQSRKKCFVRQNFIYTCISISNVHGYHPLDL